VCTRPGRGAACAACRTAGRRIPPSWGDDAVAVDLGHQVLGPAPRRRQAPERLVLEHVEAVRVERIGSDRGFQRLAGFDRALGVHAREVAGIDRHAVIGGKSGPGQERRMRAARRQRQNMEHAAVAGADFLPHRGLERRAPGGAGKPLAGARERGRGVGDLHAERKRARAERHARREPARDRDQDGEEGEVVHRPEQAPRAAQQVRVRPQHARDLIAEELDAAERHAVREREQGEQQRRDRQRHHPGAIHGRALEQRERCQQQHAEAEIIEALEFTVGARQVRQHARPEAVGVERREQVHAIGAEAGKRRSRAAEHEVARGPHHRER